jgi:hypothetical protein
MFRSERPADSGNLSYSLLYVVYGEDFLKLK